LILGRETLQVGRDADPTAKDAEMVGQDNRGRTLYYCLTLGVHVLEGAYAPKE